MDPYLIAFVLGVAGLVVMAAGAFGHVGHDAAGHTASGGPNATGSGAGHDVGQHGHTDVVSTDRDRLFAIASPRVVFSVLLGLGAAGLLLRPVLPDGVRLAVVAFAVGVLFERVAVDPVWRFVGRFASAPARTLDTALYDVVRAASGFDARGEGLVALELDGQVVQLLGRLRSEDRTQRVRVGDRLRIEDMDAERHRCTVSFVGPG